MEIWIYWTIAALLLFIVELMTAGFAVICLAFGAGAAAIAAACDATLNTQLLIFAIVSVVAIACVRPILKRTIFKSGEKVATNASAIVGKHGVVCLDGETLPKGTKVVVTAIDSVVLTVKKL